MKEVHRTLCVCSSREDRALVFPQQLQPVGDIGGMVLARLGSDLELSAQESGANLGDQFLTRVPGVTKPLRAKIARKPLRM